MKQYLLIFVFAAISLTLCGCSSSSDVPYGTYNNDPTGGIQSGRPGEGAVSAPRPFVP